MAEQPFTITSTYNPSTNTITCSSESILIKQGDIGKIKVQLQVEKDQPGTISFPFSPIEWATPDLPSDFTLSEILITAPNSNEDPKDKPYPFTIKYVYTPPGGEPVSGTGDPTIILEGTGNGSYYPES